MGFVYVHTGYLRHPKVATLTPQAKLLHLASILWTAEHLTDGYVPVAALTSLCNSVPIGNRNRARTVLALTSMGLWDDVLDGWHVHNFEVHNRSSTREVVQANREAWRQRQQRHRGQVTP